MGMRGILAAGLLMWTTMAGAAAAPADIAPAIYTDPAPDKAHPAGMEVLHIPSGGVAINGIAYVAAGPGPHPVLVLMHGLPGNEKNLDLAQAVRRAGWARSRFFSLPGRPCISIRTGCGPGPAAT